MVMAAGRGGGLDAAGLSGVVVLSVVVMSYVTVRRCLL